MTSGGALRAVSGMQHLSAELVDEITEILLDPDTRPAAICRLVGAICETVEWLHGSGAADDEIVSLRRVVAEAQRHQERMVAAQARRVA
jgi:hypothetical protein